MAEALAAEQTDLDLRLIQPAAVYRRVMHCETLPQQTADLFAEPVYQRLAVMRTQIIHHQVDGLGLWIACNDLHQIVGELRRGTVGGWFGKVPPGLWLDTAEYVGRAAPLVLAITPGNPARPHRPRRANIGVQHHWLLIHTDHGLPFR